MSLLMRSQPAGSYRGLFVKLHVGKPSQTHHGDAESLLTVTAEGLTAVKLAGQGARVLLLGGGFITAQTHKAFKNEIGNTYHWLRGSQFNAGYPVGYFDAIKDAGNYSADAMLWLDVEKYNMVQCCFYRFDSENIFLAVAVFDKTSGQWLYDLRRTSDLTVFDSLKTILNGLVLGDVAEKNLRFNALYLGDAGATAAAEAMQSVSKRHGELNIRHAEKGALKNLPIDLPYSNYRTAKYFFGLPYRTVAITLYTMLLLLLGKQSYAYYSTASEIEKVRKGTDEQSNALLLTGRQLRELVKNHRVEYAASYGLSSNAGKAISKMTTGLHTRFSVEAAGAEWILRGQFTGGRDVVSARAAQLRGQMVDGCAEELQWSEDLSSAAVKVTCRLR